MVYRLVWGEQKQFSITGNTTSGFGKLNTIRGTAKTVLACRLIYYFLRPWRVTKNFMKARRRG